MLLVVVLLAGAAAGDESVVFKDCVEFATSLVTAVVSEVLETFSSATCVRFIAPAFPVGTTGTAAATELVEALVEGDSVAAKDSSRLS